MDDSWSCRFRLILTDLQKEYQILDRNIISSLSDAANGHSVRTRRHEFLWCKIRIIFENSSYKELPFHSSCYQILGDIILDETMKHSEGLGMTKDEFLLKLNILFQLISSIETKFLIRERSQQEFANHFNDLIRTEMRKIPSNKSTALYDGFLKRWNKLYNPRSEIESFEPTKKKRRLTPNVDLDTVPYTFPSTTDFTSLSSTTFHHNYPDDSNSDPPSHSLSPLEDFNLPNPIQPNYPDVSNLPNFSNPSPLLPNPIQPNYPDVSNLPDPLHLRLTESNKISILFTEPKLNTFDEEWNKEWDKEWDKEFNSSP